MALASRRPTGLLSATDREEAAFSQLFGSIAANPSVLIIAQDDLGRRIDLWVRMGDDDQTNEMALYDALDAYHASEGVTTPVDVHLILANEPDRFFPSKLRVMYRRRS